MNADHPNGQSVTQVYLRDALIAACDRCWEKAHAADEANDPLVAACYRSEARHYRALRDKLAEGKLLVTEVA